MVARFDTKFMALNQSVTASEKKAHGNDIDSRNFIINDPIQQLRLVDHVRDQSISKGRNFLCNSIRFRHTYCSNARHIQPQSIHDP